MAEARITFYYAIVDETGWCYEVCRTSRNCDELEGYVIIDNYNPDYLEKYYNASNGKWYLEETFETEWGS